MCIRDSSFASITNSSIALPMFISPSSIVRYFIKNVSISLYNFCLLYTSHISLSSWFRDYVYIPLGGSRVSSKGRLLFNLFIVWLLTGVWHGASWNFIAWGLYFFVFLTIEKMFFPNVVKNADQQIMPCLLYTSRCV